MQWKGQHNLQIRKKRMAESGSRDIVVIGASAGGADAVSTLLSQLPSDLRAACFVVIHRQAESTSRLISILGRSSSLPVRRARETATIYHSNVYVAPADHHLILQPEQMRVVRGPKENRCRPAIDPLFRSAASAYGPRVIGILLTGYLDDGAAGLEAIKKLGGTAIVQDPEDARVPSMPTAALKRIDVDHCLPVHRMGSVLTRLIGEPPETPDFNKIPRTIEMEIAIAAGEDVQMTDQESIGKPVDLGCPECGGPLRQIVDSEIRRFRCHIGHAYTSNALLHDQDEQVERALSAALRTLEEKGRLLAEIGRETSGDEATAAGFFERADEARAHAETLRRLVLSGSDVDVEPVRQGGNGRSR